MNFFISNHNYIEGLLQCVAVIKTLTRYTTSETLIWLHIAWTPAATPSWKTSWVTTILLSSVVLSAAVSSNPKHTIYAFFNLYYWNYNEKRTKIKQKEAGIGPFKKQFTVLPLLTCLIKLWKTLCVHNCLYYGSAIKN